MAKNAMRIVAPLLLALLMLGCGNKPPPTAPTETPVEQTGSAPEEKPAGKLKFSAATQAALEDSLWDFEMSQPSDQRIALLKAAGKLDTTVIAVGESGTKLITGQLSFGRDKETGDRMMLMQLGEELQRQPMSNVKPTEDGGVQFNAQSPELLNAWELAFNKEGGKGIVKLPDYPPMAVKLTPKK